MPLEHTHLATNRYLVKTVALVLMGLVAIISVTQGFRNAINGSTDFQWSPTLLLSHGINPYSVAISGNKEGDIILTQFPPYLHLLYILFLPFAHMTFFKAKVVFAILNFLIASVCMLMLRWYFRLALVPSLLLSVLFFSSTAFRTSMGNGQTSLLCFIAFFVAWLYRDISEAKAGLSLSVLLVKYSFAPPILLWLLIERRFRSIVFSLASLASTWLLFSWICRQNPITTLEQPLKVASLYSAAGGGGGDVMTLIQSFKLDFAVFNDLRLSTFVGILVSSFLVIVLWFRSSRLSEKKVFAGLGVISMLSLRHLPYDYVFLAPAAALAFSLDSYRRAALMFALVAFFWFGLKMLDNLSISGRWVELFSFFSLNVLLALIIRFDGSTGSHLQKRIADPQLSSGVTAAIEAVFMLRPRCRISVSR